MRQTMKANVFVGKDKTEIRNKPIPKPGFNEALVRITLTTICGTDLHIVRGEYPVEAGLTIGHEPVGVVEELGPGTRGYKLGDRVLIGAITPCGQCEFCLSGKWSQCGGKLGGWKFGNTIDGCQAEYVLVPNAQANLAKIPDSLADEDVVLLADIASTGISASETANVQLGDTVAVFAQGPIGLCATAGARLKGASMIIGVESDPVRSKVAKTMGRGLCHRSINVRCCEKNHGNHFESWCGCFDRGAGHSGNIRECIACAETRRQVVELGRVFRKTRNSRRRVRRRHCRRPDSYDTLSWRQRTDAPAHGSCRGKTAELATALNTRLHTG